MLTSLFGRCIGASAVICVLLLFFFPLAQGNFQSTHGPVTAFRSKRNFLVLLFLMARAARLILAGRPPIALRQAWDSLDRKEDHSTRFNDGGSLAVLRC